jgi:hypothetical protein
MAIRAGQRKKALELAQKVIKLRGEYPYASHALEEVVRLLQDEQMRKEKRALSKRKTQ